jgi:hypothetical protein
MCGGLSSRRTVVAPRSTNFQQSARGEQNNFMPEISDPQPSLLEDLILMNNIQGISLYHDIKEDVLNHKEGFLNVYLISFLKIAHILFLVFGPCYDLCYSIYEIDRKRLRRYSAC